MPSKKIRTKTCSRCRKGIYKTKGAAISEIVKRISAGAQPLRFYPCPHEPTAFHLTSQRKRSQ